MFSSKYLGSSETQSAPRPFPFSSFWSGFTLASRCHFPEHPISFFCEHLCYAVHFIHWHCFWPDISAEKEKSVGRRTDSVSKWQKLLYLGVWCQQLWACLTVKKWELFQSCAFHWVSWSGTDAPGWSLLPPGSPGASARGCRIGVLSVPGDIQTRFISLPHPSFFVNLKESWRAREELEGGNVANAVLMYFQLPSPLHWPWRLMLEDLKEQHPPSPWMLSPSFPLLFFLFTFSSILTCSYFLKKI